MDEGGHNSRNNAHVNCVNFLVLVCLATDHPVITARAGTFKRKKQVRQFLEAMPKEDVEDIFSSAYMQNKRFEVCFCVVVFLLWDFAKLQFFLVSYFHLVIIH